MQRASSLLQAIGLINGGHAPLTLCIEPWATEYTMPPGAEWTLEVEGPAYRHARIVVERESERFVAYGWDGSDYRLLDREGNVIDDWTGNRVPDFHEGEPLSQK